VKPCDAVGLDDVFIVLAPRANDRHDARRLELGGNVVQAPCLDKALAVVDNCA
jgi:hypothetical protein